MYNNGYAIVFVPCKFAPDLLSPNSMAINICKEELEEILDEGESDFDKRVNAFEYYNCNYETGYYTAFYKFL
jgi:hypothetical protein